MFVINLNQFLLIFLISADNTFDGTIAHDNKIQVSLVKLLGEHCRLNRDKFKNIEEVCDARVPIVKFYHEPTQLNCDLSFKSGLSVLNSKLIKYVLLTILDILNLKLFYIQSA